MTPTSSSQPIFLLGATGVGKSAAAMELARAGEKVAILCLDAMQVYRGADIGTSKPTAAERAEFPHGGLDLVDLGEQFDVAQYLAHADGVFARAARGGPARDRGRRDGTLFSGADAGALRGAAGFGGIAGGTGGAFARSNCASGWKKWMRRCWRRLMRRIRAGWHARLR